MANGKSKRGRADGKRPQEHLDELKAHRSGLMGRIGETIAGDDAQNCVRWCKALEVVQGQIDRYEDKHGLGEGSGGNVWVIKYADDD